MLLAKAICKVLAPYYQVRLDMPEFGEANILHMLTGWLPDVYNLDAEG